MLNDPQMFMHITSFSTSNYLCEVGSIFHALQIRSGDLFTGLAPNHKTNKQCSLNSDSVLLISKP